MSGRCCGAVIAFLALLVACGARLRIPVPEPLHLLAASSDSRGLLGATQATDQCSQQARSEVCKDCQTALSCIRFGNTYSPGVATSCTGTKPYCVDGECVAQLSDNGTSCLHAVPSTTFTCTSDDVYGYYPDPANCRKYHFCDAQGNAYDFDCSGYPNTYYSPSTASCVPVSQTTCTTFACSTALVGSYQTYRPDPSVYVVCMDTNVANARVAKCPPNYEIDSSDLSNVACQLTCMRAGRLPYPGDSTRYYECVSLTGTTFSKPIPGVCPGNSTFSASEQRCVLPTATAVNTLSACNCIGDARGCGCS